jgi:hypothetical protein
MALSFLADWPPSRRRGEAWRREGGPAAWPIKGPSQRLHIKSSRPSHRRQEKAKVWETRLEPSPRHQAGTQPQTPGWKPSLRPTREPGGDQAEDLPPAGNLSQPSSGNPSPAVLGTAISMESKRAPPGTPRRTSRPVGGNGTTAVPANGVILVVKPKSPRSANLVGRQPLLLVLVAAIPLNSSSRPIQGCSGRISPIPANSVADRAVEVRATIILISAASADITSTCPQLSSSARTIRRGIAVVARIEAQSGVVSRPAVNTVPGSQNQRRPEHPTRAVLAFDSAGHSGDQHGRSCWEGCCRIHTDPVVGADDGLDADSVVAGDLVAWADWVRADQGWVLDAAALE